MCIIIQRISLASTNLIAFYLSKTSKPVDEVKTTDAIYLDFNKALKLSCEQLIEKLISFFQKTVAWIEMWLKDDTQKVTIKKYVWECQSTGIAVRSSYIELF